MAEIEVKELDARWQAQVAKISSAAEAGDCDYVVAVAERILEEFPGCLEVRRHLRSAQREAVRKHPAGFTRWFRGVGMQLRAVGRVRRDPERAMREAEDALAKNPGNIAAHRLLAAAALSMGFSQTAVFAFECIRELAPADGDNLIALGAALIKADRADEAIRLAEEVLAADPAHADAQRLLKDASVAHSLAQGNWAGIPPLREEQNASVRNIPRPVVPEGAAPGALREMARRMEAGIGIDPDRLDLYRELAQIWRELGEPMAALHWIERALERARRNPLTGDVPTLLEFEASLRSETLQQRVNVCRAQIEANPGDAAARSALAEAEAEARAFNRDRLARLVEKHPEEARHRLALGDLLLAEGDAERAAVHLREATRDARFAARAHLGLGRAARMRGALPGALEDVDRSLSWLLENDPIRTAALYERADVLHLMGRDEEARAAFEDILQVDAGYRDVATRLKAMALLDDNKSSPEW